MLLSDLMMVWRCLVCSLMVCALCVSSIVLFPCVVFVQQEPKTKRGIGGIKNFPLFLPTASRLLTSLTCSLRMVSGVTDAGVPKQVVHENREGVKVGPPYARDNGSH